MESHSFMLVSMVSGWVRGGRNSYRLLRLCTCNTLCFASCLNYLD